MRMNNTDIEREFVNLFKINSLDDNKKLLNSIDTVCFLLSFSNFDLKSPYKFIQSGMKNSI